MNLDITFCTNTDCPIRQKCKRGKDIKKHKHIKDLSFAYFPNNKFGCEHFKPKTIY